MTATASSKQALKKNAWSLKEVDGMTVTCSPLLDKTPGVVHVFTTRLGGSSRKPLNWFNLGRHIDDEGDRAEALANRQRLSQALSLDASKLVVPSQMHTTNIFVLEGNEIPTSLREFDAVATQRQRVPLLLHFADCVPIMLFDTQSRTLCVIHAGWRGTAGGIAARGAELLKTQFNSKPGNIVAAIGPAIGSCCYETGKDVAEKLSASVKQSSDLIERRNGKPFPDLKAINAMQLLEAGIEQIDVTQWCTACKPDLFYSHRQSGGSTGRQGALACIVE